MKNGALQTNGSLAPGNYCLTVLDDKSCEAAQACFEVIDRPIEINSDITHQTCEETGSIDLIVSGGAGNYTYNWFDLAGSDNPEDRIDLEAGVYSVIVIDANGCEVTSQDIVLNNECGCNDPVINDINVIESRCGESTGQITINMFGNNDNYLYVWSPNVSATNTATALSSGTYTVTIADTLNNSCFIVEDIAIGVNDGPDANITSTSPANCNAADGRASLSLLIILIVGVTMH